MTNDRKEKVALEERTATFGESVITFAKQLHLIFAAICRGGTQWGTS